MNKQEKQLQAEISRLKSEIDSNVTGVIQRLKELVLLECTCTFERKWRSRVAFVDVSDTSFEIGIKPVDGGYDAIAVLTYTPGESKFVIEAHEVLDLDQRIESDIPSKCIETFNKWVIDVLG